MRALGGAAAALIAVVIGAMGASPPGSASERFDTGPSTAWVVGDSITYQGEETLRQELRADVSGSISIDGVPGRSVADLDDLVASELTTEADPDVMVLALGSNPSPVWRRGDYRSVVESIPDTTVVVLVTVYRTDVSEGPVVARRMAAYSRWMREIAAGRSNVCLAKWRAAVKPDPQRLLFDGVHPNDQGQQVWAGLIRSAVERCSQP
ncbi:MAG TPA: SGNH/GDSL hydrolase family protein [Nocardioides sp.]|nr:SGNH/GDSL hydrolase family protein [Nocardioides sp.]